jgi:3-oxoadipate enol-lactonase
MTAGVATLPDGARLAWRIDGAGPALLLCRSLGGSLALWGRFRELLAARATVISFDARGVGGSSPPPPTVTTRQLAADARALLDALRIERAAVLGESLGGMVATWLAVDAGPRVERLVLLSTVPRGAGLGPLASPRRLVRGLGLAACFARGQRRAGRCLAERIVSARFRAEHPDDAAGFAAALAAEGIRRRDTLALLGAAARHDVTAHLAGVTAPTLVLCGGHDPLITVDTQRELLGALPDATFEVVAAAGHAITLEQPDDAAARVAAFLELQ